MATDNSNLKCDFCGKGRNEVEKLVVGHNVGICSDWVEKIQAEREKFVDIQNFII